MIIEFKEEKRRTFAKFVGISHWVCILPSFICLLLALYIQIVIDDKILFIEDYNGAVLPGFLVFCGFFGFFAHILCGKVAYSNRIPEKREKWMRFLLPAVIATIIIFLAEFIAGIICFAHIQNLEESLNTGIKLAMIAYKDDATTKEEVDMLQMAYECCGSKSYTDWFSISWIHPDYINAVKLQARISKTGSAINDDVPFSCCSPHVLRPCIRHHVHDNALHYNYDFRQTTTLHTAGCTDKLMAFYEHSVLLVAGALVLSLSFIQLILAISFRFLQTSIHSVMSSGDKEGPSIGYLFSDPQKPSGMDTTVTSTEYDTLLDTTAETPLTMDTEEFLGERYVGMDSAGMESAGTEPYYENVAPFESFDEYIEPVGKEEHIYNEGEVEEYLASKFAHSREMFEPIPDYENVPPPYAAPLPPAPPPPPPPNVNYNRSKPSLTKVRSNYGSYMAMNVSNSSWAPPRNVTQDKVPKRHRKHHKGLHRKRHSIARPTFQTSSPKGTFIIDMARNMSPDRMRSRSRRRYTHPESEQLIGTHFFNRSPVRGGPPNEPCFYKHSSSQISPQRVSPSRRDTDVSPNLFTSKIGKRQSPQRKRSPMRRISPQKTIFKSGISYGCNHAYD